MLSARVQPACPAASACHICCLAMYSLQLPSVDSTVLDSAAGRSSLVMMEQPYSYATRRAGRVTSRSPQVSP